MKILNGIENETGISRQKVSWIMIGIIGALLLFSFGVRAFTSSFGADEREHMQAAFLVYSGLVPYRDFFQHHHPLLWYALRPFLYLFGNSPYVWFWVRGVVCLLSVGIAYFIYKISVIAGLSVKGAVVAAFGWFACYVVRRVGVEIRPDLLMLLFYLAGMYYFFSYLKCLRFGYCLAAFVLFFLSFLTLQKIVFLLFWQGLVTLWLLYRKKMIWFDVGLSLAVVSVLCVMFAGAMYQAGVLKDYWELNWLLNFKIKVISEVAYKDLYVFWVAAVLAGGVVICSKNEAMRIISFLYLTMCAILAVWRPWHYQYLLPYCAFMVIIFSYVVAEPLLKHKFQALVLGVLVLFCGMQAYEIWKHRKDEYFRLSVYTEPLDLMLKKTKPGDLILGNGEDMISTMRGNALGYYWFSLGLVGALDAAVYHRHELPNFDLIIKTRRPKAVVNGFWRDCSLGMIYIPNKECPFWESIDKDYLNEHYESFGFVYIRKD